MRNVRLQKIDVARRDFIILCFCIFFYGFDREPDRMNTILPLVEARSENSIPRIILAYADGFFVDFPASLFMTLTGSFWYLPLTEYAEK